MVLSGPFGNITVTSQNIMQTRLVMITKFQDISIMFIGSIFPYINFHLCFTYIKCWPISILYAASVFFVISPAAILDFFGCKQQVITMTRLYWLREQSSAFSLTDFNGTRWQSACLCIYFFPLYALSHPGRHTHIPTQI